ncbi:hypothetical protein MKX03_012723 [Papaver bracteatum]|nr:hypothetical protein MKX03_012723 [Papaver bracteatum]
MNQILRFSACRRSLLRRDQFTRWSSKPISSSPLISNNQTSSKFHHTLNYPPQIFSTPGNHFRKFSGEPAAAECKFNLIREICRVHDAVLDAQGNIELGYLPPLDAAKIPAEKFKALMEKLGLNKEKSGDYPEEIQSLKESVDQVVAFGKFAATGKNSELPYIWGVFKRWYSAGGKFEEETSESDSESEDEGDTLPTAEYQIGMHVDDASSAVVAVNKADIEAAKFNSDDDYLAKEFKEVYDALLAAHDHIELGTLPPLEAAKIMVDKFKAIMEIVGLDYEDNGDWGLSGSPA